ncbi:homeobox-domain-containing protein [Coprinopsis marcescibilis]|uniref:Homeobox-domain-containing protein n=1 Tax=Coprinopsis marcescibilis TaxID=230819 RepID=A0A5C3KSW3_COPMA|nr:homeobox-domain-containing protein [Coprinopsis marcescibilis]
MSTSSSKDRYYTANTLVKSRRSSPGDSQNSLFSFQTGQGGRTTLPSFHSAFPNLPFPGPYPNAYTAPRSSPGRGYDINPQAPQFYQSHWPTGNSPSLAPAYPNYDTTSGHGHDRHSPQPNYATYSSARGTPPLMSNPDPRRLQLPPLATSSSPGGDRWQSSYGMPAPQPYISGNSIRSPAASYPSQYMYPNSNQQSSYTYQDGGYGDLSSLNPQSQPTLYDEMHQGHLHQRPNSPYGRVHGSSQMSSSDYTPPPVSPTSPDEPTIKKKRKRADAAQLKVLNETYARTAFPSTEERHALAKALDMSARSVQIWFQNKRQSMRQTNRQSSTVSPTHQQQFGLPAPQGLGDDISRPSSNYPGASLTLPESQYMGSAQGMSRSHPSLAASAHRRIRSPEEAESHKWNRGY